MALSQKKEYIPMRSQQAVLVVMVGLVALMPLYPLPLLDAKETRKAIDCYGDELPPGALLRLGTTRFRENFRCYAVAYSPDGKLLASAGDGGVVLWEAESGKRRDFLESRVTSTGVALGVNSRMFVCSLAFSGDSRYLAAGCEQETIVWELASVVSHKTCNEFGAWLVNHGRIFWLVQVHSKGWA
jgi:WD40 repeat protein